jgi:hypothetical protein
LLQDTSRVPQAFIDNNPLDAAHDVLTGHLLQRTERRNRTRIRRSACSS